MPSQFPSRPLRAVALVAALFASAPAFAEETPCTSSIGAVTLDNIFVPDGAMCVLTGTTAKGNIVVGSAASLRAARVSVSGNVQAEGAAEVTLTGSSSVGGSVQIVQGSAATVEMSRINGDILLDANNGPLAALRNSVGGSLQVFQNRGGVTLRGNVIKGNLQCKENAPAPVGGGNRASSKEDQCERL